MQFDIVPNHYSELAARGTLTAEVWARKLDEININKSDLILFANNQQNDQGLDCNS